MKSSKIIFLKNQKNLIQRQVLGFGQKTTSIWVIALVYNALCPALKTNYNVFYFKQGKTTSRKYYSIQLAEVHSII